jgi:hypothetical protein
LTVQDHARIGRPLLNAIDERDLIFELQSERDIPFRVLGFGRSGDAEGGEADQGGGAERRRAGVLTCKVHLAPFLFQTIETKKLS